MKFKVLCSDLDGTLLTTKSNVSQFTVSTINHIKNEMRVILVSARMPSGMRYIQQDLGILDQPIICYNGALVLDGEKELLSIFIPLETVKSIYDICKSLKIELGLYVNDQWFVANASERVDKEIRYTKTYPSFIPYSITFRYLEKEKLGAHKLMLMGTKESADELMPMLHENFESELTIYRSNDTLIEVAPKLVSKLSAIELLLKPDESLADVIAFGDNYNDIEMLEAVGTGVAVGNAREEVKNIANYIALANGDDGVADFIEKNIRI